MLGLFPLNSKMHSADMARSTTTLTCSHPTGGPFCKGTARHVGRATPRQKTDRPGLCIDLVPAGQPYLANVRRMYLLLLAVWRGMAITDSKQHWQFLSFHHHDDYAKL